MEKENNEIKYGGFWIRFIALMLDGIVVNAVMSLVYMLFGRHYSFPFNSDFNSLAVFSSSPESYISMLTQWGYNILMLRYYGATLGKMALQIRVVGKEHELDWITIILRETVGKMVSGIILGIGYLMIAWDPKKQALHDKISGTYVIKE